MGDKSPKSKQRKQKQSAVAKSQKQLDAHTKAHPTSTVPGKQGK